MFSFSVFDLVLVLLLSGVSKAVPAVSSTAVTAPNPQSTACGDIVNNEGNSPKKVLGDLRI
jgi:hypothetical protein